MTDTKAPFSQPNDRLHFWQQPGFMIGTLITVYLVAGLLLVTHYGESWDEPEYIKYANSSLAAYSGGSTYWPEEKGPFFGMLAMIGTKGLQSLISGWKFIDGWHFMTFLAFLMGIYFFFRLCRRLVDPAPALAATVLFSTQPIVWGHAFFNHQDIPFMAFFLASVTLGLEMVDHYRRQGYTSAVDVKSFLPWFAAKRKAVSRRNRRLLIIISSVWLGYLLISPLFQPGVAWFINQAYHAPDSSGLGQLFSRFAQQAGEIPVGAYVSKAQIVISKYVLWPWIGLSLVLALTASWFLGLNHWIVNVVRRSSAEWKSAPWRRRSLQISLLLLIIAVGFLFRETQLVKYIWLAGIVEICLLFLSIKVAQKIFPSVIGRMLSLMIELRVLIAACFMGFTSDIRTLGIASGILIGIYSLFKNGRKAVPIMLSYFAVGAVTIYLFWPYLWNSPTNFFGSLSMAANFPLGGLVTFAGQRIPNNELPITYFPTLFGLQFTETALIAILAGIVLTGIYIWKRKGVRLDLLLLVCWFAAPVGAAILLHSTLYNNFRQFLFIVPPLFILSGLALQVCWNFLRAHKISAVFALLGLTLIVPGIYWDIQLHPFEYIYYNSLIGNVKGAFRSFPLDYWSTSFMTDMEYVNATAPQNSTVFVDEPYRIVLPYARPDLKIIGRPLPVNSANENYYAIFLAEDYKDQTLFPRSQVFFQVTRDNAILSVVKIVQPADPVRK